MSSNVTKTKTFPDGTTLVVSSGLQKSPIITFATASENEQDTTNAITDTEKTNLQLC